MMHTLSDTDLCDQILRFCQKYDVTDLYDCIERLRSCSELYTFWQALNFRGDFWLLLRLRSSASRLFLVESCGLLRTTCVHTSSFSLFVHETG